MIRQVTFAILSVFLSFSLISQEKANKPLLEFDELIVIGNFPVEIEVSDRSEAQIETFSADVNLDNLTFTYSCSTLTIRYSGSFVKDIDLDLVLYYPKLISSIEAKRGAEIRINNAGTSENELNLKVDAGGKLLVKNIVADSIKARITKGGSIQIDGETKHFEPSISAGGTIASANLKAYTITANVTLGGEIICAPVDLLNADVRSGGTISYKGNPVVNQSIKLGGTIEQL